MRTEQPRQPPSVFAAAGLLMGGRTIGFAATFLTPVILARVFSPAEFGTYKQLFLVFATLYPIAQFGMAESLFYFLPDSGEAAANYAANSTMLLGIAGATAMAGVVMVRQGIAHWLGNPALAQDLPLIGAFSALMLTAAGFEIVMTAGSRYRLAGLTYAVSDITRGVCLIIPGIVFQRLDAVVLGAVIFACLRLASTAVYFRRAFGARFRPDLGLLARQLTYSVPFALAIVLETAQANYHQYAVAHFFDAAAFAVYSIGCLQIPLVDFVATSTSSVMMVELAKARLGERDDRALAIWLDTTRKLALVFTPMAAVLLVAAPNLIVIVFTERYAASVGIFQISLASIALSAFATDAVLRAYAETRLLMGLSALKLVVVALLVGPAIRVGGLPGAIFATVAALGIAKVLAVLRIARIWRTSVRRVLPWRSLADITGIATVAAVAGLTVRQFVQDALASLALSTSLTAFVCVVLALAGNVVNEGERATATKWLWRTIGRTPAAAGSDG